MAAPPTRTARSDAPLAAAWLVTAAAVGVVGWLLFALSEASAGRAVGVALLVAAVLAAALGLALLVRSAAVRRWSPAMSAASVVLGVVCGAVLLTDDAFLSDALLVSAPPVVGGVVTALLAGRRRG